MLLAFIHSLPLALVVMIFLGVNWVIIPTNFNTATQTSVPLWVKGRAISFYLTVLFGSFAIGAKIWGPITTYFSPPTGPKTGIHESLLIGGVAMAAFVVLAKWFPLTRSQGLDLSAAFAGAPPRPVLPDLVPPMTVGGPQPIISSVPERDVNTLAGPCVCRCNTMWSRRR